MFDLTLICVGRNKEKYFQDAASEYIKRMVPFCRVSVIEVSEVRLSASPSEKEIRSALREEAESIKKIINREQFVIALCVEGKKLSSSGFSDVLMKAFVSGKSRLVFVIGGSFGLAEEIKNTADLRLSISDMTFPHHLVRVMLLEQIYRSFSILNGTKYNK